MPGDPAIVAEGLTKRYGSTASPVDATFRVERGTTFGLIGPSGSGKSSTVRILAGYTPATSGHAVVLGTDPGRFGADDRRRLGYLPQRPVLYPKLSIRSNVSFVAALYGVRHRRRRVREVLDFVELWRDRRKRLDEASGGMQRRAALATALVHEPQLLFLDEPTSGLDPVLRTKLWDHFSRLRDEGRTLVVTTQYVEEALRCDLVGLMVEGRLIAVDTPLGLRRLAVEGDLLHVAFDAPVAGAALAALGSLGSLVKRARAVDDRGLEIVVADAPRAMVPVVDALERAGARPVAVEQVVAPMEDVFTTLVARDRQRHAA